MLWNSSCFHFILLRTAQSKYIENTTTRPKNIKLTHKCPVTDCINSGKQFSHNLVNQYTLPSSCRCPEIMIKDTFLSRPMTHWDEGVNYHNLCTLLNAIFSHQHSLSLMHALYVINNWWDDKNFEWNLTKTTRVWTTCAWVSKTPCLPRQWNS